MLYGAPYSWVLKRLTEQSQPSLCLHFSNHACGHWGNVDMSVNNGSDDATVVSPWQGRGWVQIQGGRDWCAVSWGTMWLQRFGHSAGLLRKTQATLPIHSLTHSFIHSVSHSFIKPTAGFTADLTTDALKTSRTPVHVSEFRLGKSDSKQRTAADKIFLQASRAPGLHWDTSFPLSFHFNRKLDLFFYLHRLLL